MDAEGREIVFNAWKPGEPSELWRIAASGEGKPRPLPFSGSSPAVSHTGRRIAYARSSYDTNIWRVDLDKPGGHASSRNRVTASTMSETNHSSLLKARG